MKDGFKRFNMKKKPKRQRLRPLVWALSFPSVWKHKTKIIKVNMQDITPPYILLCNHNSFLDFKVASVATFPRRSNNIVAIDGFTMLLAKKFISREWLLRAVGCICKRKFTNDIVLIRNLRRVIDNGDIAVIYPEARYSLCGTNSDLPESLGKLCKMFKVPVVTLIMKGHHINSPFWNTKDREVKPTEAVMTKIFDEEDIKKADVSQINARIAEFFKHDDFTWQKERLIEVKFDKRAEGLHKVLYQCPSCFVEYKMSSSGIKLICNACGKSWTMSTLGELSADAGETEFSHIPDWYEWERENVRNEITSGTYSFCGSVNVKSLPNSKGYIDLGEGSMRHDMKGFHVEVNGKHGKFEMIKPPLSSDACHIEYNYLNRYGDCVDLNTLEDTWYIYPSGEDFSVTKIALATEELYKKCNEK